MENNQLQGDSVSCHAATQHSVVDDFPPTARRRQVFYSLQFCISGAAIRPQPPRVVKVYLLFLCAERLIPSEKRKIELRSPNQQILIGFGDSSRPRALNTGPAGTRQRQRGKADRIVFIVRTQYSPFRESDACLPTGDAARLKAK